MKHLIRLYLSTKEISALSDVCYDYLDASEGAGESYDFPCKVVHKLLDILKEAS